MILVTGGSGFLGNHIVRRLMAAGHPVRAMVRNQARAEAEGRLHGLDLEWVEADVTQPASLPVALSGVSAVVHTVAIAIERGDSSYDQTNFQGTVNVVEAAAEAGVDRFINISQLGAAPDLPYRFLASKGKAQAYVAQSDLDWTAFRPSVIWGPQDEFANTFARLVPLTPLIFPIVGTSESRFQPVWVQDVAEAVAGALADSGTIGDEYELGGPEVLSLEEIERRTLRALGARRLFVPFPLPLLRLIVAVMQTVFPNPPVTSSLLELLQVSNVPSNNQIQRFVEQPSPFAEENIRDYMRQFRARDTLRQFFGG